MPPQQLIVHLSKEDQLENHFCIIFRNQSEPPWYPPEGLDLYDILRFNQTNCAETLASLFIQAIWNLFPSALFIWNMKAESGSVRAVFCFVGTIRCYENTAEQGALLIHMHLRSQHGDMHTTAHRAQTDSCIFMTMECMSGSFLNQNKCSKHAQVLCPVLHFFYLYIFINLY